MKKSILNLGTILSKAEQKTIQGGDGPCSVYAVDSGWIAGYSLEDAQFLYGDGTDPYVKGYCCANCGKMNAELM